MLLEAAAALIYKWERSVLLRVGYDYILQLRSNKMQSFPLLSNTLQKHFVHVVVRFIHTTYILLYQLNSIHFIHISLVIAHYYQSPPSLPPPVIHSPASVYLAPVLGVVSSVCMVGGGQEAVAGLGSGLDQ